MRIYVAYHDLQVHAVRMILEPALRQQCYAQPLFDILFAHMDGPLSYHKFLSDLWDRKQRFILLEGDTLPPWGALQEMDACASPWCTVPYLMRRTSLLTTGLGCVKLDVAALPLTDDERSKFFVETFEGKPWDQRHAVQDMQLLDRMWLVHKIRPCVHQDRVAYHFNEGHIPVKQGNEP